MTVISQVKATTNLMVNELNVLFTWYGIWDLAQIKDTTQEKEEAKNPFTEQTSPCGQLIMKLPSFGSSQRL